MLLAHGPRTTFNAGSMVRTGYIRGAGFIVLVTMMYPIAWGCCEGGNVVSPTGEMIWYGVLDILAGPVFLFMLLWGLRSIEYSTFGLGSTKWSDNAAYGGGPGYGPGAANGRTVPAGAGPNMTAAPNTATGTAAGAGPNVGVGPHAGIGTNGAARTAV